MARLEYPRPDGRDWHDLVAGIQEKRGGEFPRLFAMLSHSVPVARAWLELGTAIRYETTLDDRLRELVICLVARIARSEYEWDYHAPLAVQAGVSAEELQALSPFDGAAFTNPREQAALRYTHAVAADVTVADPTFADLRSHYTDREIIEITATVGYYAATARILVPLGVELEPRGDGQEQPLHTTRERPSDA